MATAHVETRFNFAVNEFHFHSKLGHRYEGMHVEPVKRSGIPLVIGLGWGTTTSIYKNTMQFVAGRGIDSWCINPPRIGRNTPVTEHNIAEVEYHKAEAIETLLQELHKKGHEEVDIVAHSEGAIYTTVAALLALSDKDSAKVRSLTLVAPAGLMGEDTTAQLVARFITQRRKNIFKNMIIFAQSRNKNKAFLDPVTSAFEADAIANTHLVDLLQILWEKTHLKINVIGGDYDGVFPPKRLQQTLQNAGFAYGFSTLPMGHDGAYIEPEMIGTKITEIVNNIDAEGFHVNTPIDSDETLSVQ